MFDLKALKKQLHSSRSELDALRMKGLDDNSEDFSNQIGTVGSWSNNTMQSKASEEPASISEADKENVGNDDRVTESKLGRGSEKKPFLASKKIQGVPYARSE